LKIFSLPHILFIFFCFSARDFSRGFVDTNLHASYDGEIQWAPPQKIYSRCHMDVAKFPFDHQFCSLIFRSWIYDTSQLDLTILTRYDGKSPFTKDSFTENGEWEIVDNRTFRYQHHSGRTESVLPNISFVLDVNELIA
ncbi:hypothetical protein ANCCAN_13499, partial [Ancylostoma caninum]